MASPPAAEFHQDARRADAYLQLRQWLGVIGATLPFVLVLGNAFLRSVLVGPPAWRGWDLQHSMSGYYFTPMQNVFVGALCAIGAFLLSYKGYDKKDAWAGTLAGLFAIGAGLFPTIPPSGKVTVISEFHIGFAAALYLTLAYFAIVRFPVTDRARAGRNAARNILYRVCGWTIIACLVLIAISEKHFVRARVGSYHPAFWLESLATISFGVSWLTKGEKILRDANPAPQ
jgi:hypothetical protein